MLFGYFLHDAKSDNPYSLAGRFEVCKTSKLSRKGNGLVLFAACKKYRKNTLGRAKSCRWQVFVRRRPPKQGELRTDVSKATMFQGDGEALRPTIQIAGRYGVFAKVTGVHQVTGYAENCIFPGIAGNDLNRCEIRALQHKELERRSKE